jgi:hypothetical protein
MKKGGKSLLPFMDILVTNKPDGSPRYTVYRKPTHTDLYLHAKSHHLPSQKHTIPTTLINQATPVCDTKCLYTEIWHLKEALRLNGYSGADFKRAMYRKNKTATEKYKLIGVIILPFQYTTSYRISRLHCG